MVTVTTVWSEFDFLENIPEDERRPIALKKAHKAKKIFSLDVGSALKLIDELKQSHAWLLLGCASFEDMLTELIQITPQALQEFEEGYQILKGRGVSGPIKGSEAIAVLAEKAEPLEEHEYGKGKAGPGRGNKNTLYNNVFNDPQQGTSADYLTRRIARDRPDILEDMKAGKYPSVRAAAKDAGIVKDLTPLQRAQRLWLKLSEEDRQAFLDFIHEKKE